MSVALLPSYAYSANVFNEYSFDPPVSDPVFLKIIQDNNYFPNKQVIIVNVQGFAGYSIYYVDLDTSKHFHFDNNGSGSWVLKYSYNTGGSERFNYYRQVYNSNTQVYGSPTVVQAYQEGV